eukprot:13034628-Heterocapsa_arctica.AAC.1
MCIGSTPKMNHIRQKGDSQCRTKYGQSHPVCQINHLVSNVYITCEMDRRMHMLRKGRTMKIAKIKKHVIHNYMIGEASNPGPTGSDNKQSKHMKLGEYFHQKHTMKDDKAELCKAKGYSIENIAGDGNCLYTSLGRSRKLSGNQVRQFLLMKSEAH